MSEITISKSGKDRFPAYYHPKDGKQVLKEDNYPCAWKQVVDKFEIGKNKKGKKIYGSHTRHVRA